jgi:putative transposase
MEWNGMAWHGMTVNHVDLFYPSSQISSNCGKKNPEVRNLAIREWTCSECGTRHDRDINASINILNQGRGLNASLQIINMYN